MYNKVIFIGNLTKDATLKHLSTGTPISEFALAINTKYGDKDEVLFIDNVLFGKTAEALNQYLKKGTQILVEGRLQEQKWESDGQKKSKHVVIVNNVRLLRSKETKEKQKTDDGLEPF